jgi:hypothetical protein
MSESRFKMVLTLGSPLLWRGTTFGCCSLRILKRQFQSKLNLFWVCGISCFAVGRGVTPIVRAGRAHADTIGFLVYIVISTLLLDFVAGAARDHQTDAMESLLEQYLTAIRSARDTIANSDRDPTRNPAGYKDLELALRQQVRRLEDLSRTLAFDERGGVDRAVYRCDHDSRRTHTVALSAVEFIAFVPKFLKDSAISLFQLQELASLILRSPSIPTSFRLRKPESP